ncbi:hypothetical protein CPB86DRAFT_106319 [Serendipita vermifera]|nr:hypothetical protein CPB86DRAFT_106319 [Serendipita vermifera]
MLSSTLCEYRITVCSFMLVAQTESDDTRCSVYRIEASFSSLENEMTPSTTEGVRPGGDTVDWLSVGIERHKARYVGTRYP